MLKQQQVTSGVWQCLPLSIGSGPGHPDSALARQVSVLTHLLLLGFESSSGLEDTMPPLNSCEEKLGGREMEAWDLEKQVKRPLITSFS